VIAPLRGVDTTTPTSASAARARDRGLVGVATTVQQVLAFSRTRGHPA